VYWSKPTNEKGEPIFLSHLTRGALYVCLAGLLILGIFPGFLLNWANQVFIAMP
jgi:hypothetical protein